jgi:hypothetical protein
VDGQLHAPAIYPRGKSSQSSLDRRLGGPQSRSGRRGEEKMLDPNGTLTPTLRSSSPLPVAIPTMLSRLRGPKHVAVINKNNVNNYISLFWNICCVDGQSATHHATHNKYNSWGPFGQPLLSEPDSTYSPVTDLWLKNSSIPDVNEVRPTIQVVARRTYSHRHTDGRISCIPNTTISYSGVLKKYKTVSTSRSIFLQDYSIVSCIIHTVYTWKRNWAVYRMSGWNSLRCWIHTVMSLKSRAVWGMNSLRSLESWDRGFKSHPRHGCLCAIILCLCCSVCK